jgi:IclR family mhp operon transcriptional activator
VATDDRLLQVLRALNEIGPCSVLGLHRATGISRQAIYRVIDSLCRHGYVRRIADDTRFRLTSEVRALSAGYRDDNWIVEAGTPVLARLQREVRWPSSLALPDKDKMVVRETNRHRSPFVFDRGGVGMCLPMLKSSLGIAYMAFCERRTRQITLALLRRSAERWDAIARNQRETERLLRNTVQRGYSFRQGGIEERTSSIAVPIMSQNEAVGSICVTYATSALTPRLAATQFLPALRTAAAEIAAASKQP